VPSIKSALVSKSSVWWTGSNYYLREVSEVFDVANGLFGYGIAGIYLSIRKRSVLDIVYIFMQSIFTIAQSLAKVCEDLVAGPGAVVVDQDAENYSF
jgi:hypothetical protein